MNRGVLMTPFHNMALMSPATTEADVDRHTEVFGEAVEALFGRGVMADDPPARRGCGPPSCSRSRSTSS